MNTEHLTLLRPRLVKHYKMQGNPVTVECESGHGADEPDPITLRCPECSLPFVVAQAILLMATHNIRRLVIDGCEVDFSHTTTAAR